MNHNDAPTIKFSSDQPQVIATLTPHGQIMRGDKKLEDLDRDELIQMVKDLIATLQRSV